MKPQLPLDVFEFHPLAMPFFTASKQYNYTIAFYCNTACIAVPSFGDISETFLENNNSCFLEQQAQFLHCFIQHFIII